MESTHAATMAAYSAGVPPPSPKPKAENPAAEKPQGQWRVGLLGKDKAFLDLSADAKAAEAKRRVRVLLHHYADAKVDLLAMLDHHVTADNAELMTELFRFVHTLKGNSGLFEFPEMTRVLHAGEDLMDAVRKGRVGYSQALADQLLDAMDFVGILCDEIDADGRIDASRAADSARLAKVLARKGKEPGCFKKLPRSCFTK